MNNKELAYKLQDFFINQSVIATKEIVDVLIQAFPELSPNTISWRINQLKKENLIFQVGRGLYSFEYKPEFKVEISLKTKRLFNRISTLSKNGIVIWDINLLKDISSNKIKKNWHFIYLKKDEIEIVFEELQKSSKPIFLQPDNHVINRYLLGQDEAIILLPLISEMPIVKVGDYSIPSLEGLLVNSWLKYESYLKPIGYDINQIFKNAFSEYNVNRSKLQRYATRRDKRQEINELINSIT